MVVIPEPATSPISNRVGRFAGFAPPLLFAASPA